MTIQTDSRIWESMLGCLRSNHPQICRHWFGDLEPLGVHDGSIYLRAHSEMQRDYLRSKCVDAFNDAARESTSQLLGIRFLGPREDAPRAAGRDAAQPADLNHAADGTPPGLDGPLIEIPRPDAPRQFGRNASEPLRVTPRAPSEPRRRIPGDTERLDEPEQIILNPDYGFEHFVVGPGNRLAHAASVAVANNPGRAYNPLFIHGDVGLGKTHLLQAICVQLLTERPGLILHYTSCDVFVNGFMESVRSGHMSQFRHRFRDVDVLVIDDIHFLANRDRTQEEFFHTFNSLYQANKQIVLSSDAAPDEIPNLENRLVSRFNWGLVTKVDPPGYETRVAILQTKASLRGIELTDEVASFVAARVTTNIRELEGAITKLQIHARVSGREIDVGLAREALGVTDEDRVGRAPSIDSIISTVSDHFGVKRTDVLGKKRHRSISLPRQICMFLAKKQTRQSLQEIGAYFGGRDHTTVLHAVRTIEKRRQEDPRLDLIIQRFEQRMGRGEAI